MYSENRVRDLRLFAKACATNLVARFAPSTYVRLTGQTGRGSDDDDVDQVVRYFETCVADYRDQLGLDEAAFARFIAGRQVLEYGPGDVLGVALLLYAAGARQVHCVDRFPLQHVTEKNALVYRRLVERMAEPMRRRAEQAFIDMKRPQDGLREDCIAYRITPDGLADRPAAYDLILSRAVLEHVNSLEGTIADIERCLAPGGVSLHSVDLRSHNLDRDRPYDFLTWPDWAYRLMYSHKGFPNRWRVGAYRRLLASSKLRVRSVAPTGRLPQPDVARIRPHLAERLRDTDGEELSWLGFWVVVEKPA